MHRSGHANSILHEDSYTANYPLLWNIHFEFYKDARNFPRILWKSIVRLQPSSPVHHLCCRSNESLTRAPLLINNPTLVKVD